MRIQFAFTLGLLVASATAGCGAVDDGQCATADQDDGVACTLDVCNAEAGGWAHLPNNNLCDTGQACSPTAGCVAAGALTGHATMFGQTDNSGIEVTVEGLEGATATTDAAGNWTIVVPPGAYNVIFSKAKYESQKSTNIVVLAEAAQRVPDVQLQHGSRLGEDRVVTSGYGSFLNSDDTYLIEIIATPFGNGYYATPVDGSKKPVLIVTNPTNLTVTANHAVWKTSANGTSAIWARPLSGDAPAVQLKNVGLNETIDVLGAASNYVAMLQTRPVPGYQEYSVWVANVDGTANPTTAAWTQPDALHGFNGFVNNETHGLVFLYNSTNPNGPPTDPAANSPLVRIDFAANTGTPVSIGFAANNASAYFASPTGDHVLGYAYQYTGTVSWYRGFMAAVSGTAAPALSPSYGPPSSGYEYTDYPCDIYGWLEDGSGIVYQGCSYPSGGNQVAAELRVWMTSSATSSVIAPYNPQGYYPAYYTGVMAPTLVGKNLIYGDGSYPTRTVKVASLSNSPSSYTLDSSGNALVGSWISSDKQYFVWTDSNVPNNYANVKIHSAPIPANLTTQPTVTQLGTDIPNTCSFEGRLSGTTFFVFCNDARTATAYPKSSATPTGTADDIVGPKWNFDKSNRVGFRRGDGKLYTLGDDLKVLANDIDPTANPMMALDPKFGGAYPNVHSDWVFYRDGSNQMTRVSRADGSIIDEPFLPCDVSSTIWSSSDGAHLMMPSVRCENLRYDVAHVAASNLP